MEFVYALIVPLSADQLLPQLLMKQFEIRKAFSKFYHRHSELIVKYSIGLKTLLQQGISEPIFMVIWFINSNELLENLILVINSKI